MAPAARGPGGPRRDPYDDDVDLDRETPPRLKGALRTLEAILFCCLSATAILWVVDRTRDLNFDPVEVTPCTEDTCAPSMRPDPWERYTALRDAGGVRTLERENFCAMAVGLLEDHATDEAAMRVVTELETRGVIGVREAGEASVVVTPGRRNDGWGDVMRDAVRFGQTRGCYPSNYAPVMRPLLIAWILVMLLRLFRNLQEVWRQR